MAFQTQINKLHKRIKDFEADKAAEYERLLQERDLFAQIVDTIPGAIDMYTPHGYPADFRVRMESMSTQSAFDYMGKLKLLPAVRCATGGTMLYRQEVGARLIDCDGISPTFMNVDQVSSTGKLAAELCGFVLVGTKVAKVAVPIDDVNWWLKREPTRYSQLERHFGMYNMWAGGGATFYNVDSERFVKGKRTRLFDKTFRVLAYFIDSLDGAKKANEYMLKYPGASLLKLEDGLIYLADKHDEGENAS